MAKGGGEVAEAAAAAAAAANLLVGYVSRWRATLRARSVQ